MERVGLIWPAGPSRLQAGLVTMGPACRMPSLPLSTRRCARRPCTASTPTTGPLPRITTVIERVTGRGIRRIGGTPHVASRLFVTAAYHLGHSSVREPQPHSRPVMDGVLAPARPWLATGVRGDRGDEVRRPAEWAVHSGLITCSKLMEQPKEMRVVERSEGLVDDRLAIMPADHAGGCGSAARCQSTPRVRIPLLRGPDPAWD